MVLITLFAVHQHQLVFDLSDCNTISWTPGSYDGETSWTLQMLASEFQVDQVQETMEACVVDVPGCTDEMH